MSAQLPCRHQAANFLSFPRRTITLQIEPTRYRACHIYSVRNLVLVVMLLTTLNSYFIFSPIMCQVLGALIEKDSKLFCSRKSTQTSQCLVFKLSNTFTTKSKHISYFSQKMSFKPQTNNPSFSRRKK